MTTTTSPPDLASASPPGGLTALQGWLLGPARWVGWLVIPLVPLFIFSAAIGYEIVEESCRGAFVPGPRSSQRASYDQSCVDNGAYAMGLVSLLYVLLAVLFLASAYATLRRSSGSIPAAERIARLQGVKDWFVRGDIQEEDYQGLRQLIDAQDDAKSLGAAGRRGASLFRAAAFLLIPAGFFWVMFIMIYIDELPVSENPVPFLVNGVGGGLLFLALFVASLIRAVRLDRFGAAFADSIRRRIDAAEDQVMRAARTRSGRHDAAAAPTAASYRAYSRR